MSTSPWNTGLARRRAMSSAFSVTCAAAAFVGVAALVIMLGDILHDGSARLTLDFLQGFPSRFAAKAGFKAALWGSVWVVCTTTVFAVPVGVAAALYLEEFATRNRFTGLLELNIANLAGVPSIVYGVLGLAVFVRGMGFGPSVLSAALTLSLLVLPTVIVVSREAIRTVPPSLRQAAFAVGATKWQAAWHHVLPAALPGILTGVILSVSRAMGETAPLITMGALTYVAFTPTGITDSFTVMPIQVFNWASRPQPAFAELAAAGILVLLTVLLILNAIAIYLRHRHQGRFES